MKKILVLAFFAAACMVANSQTLSNQEIANVISLSKEFNEANGIKNPNIILIGQKLTFKFSDGFIGSITAEKNDSQWKILKQKLGKLTQEHGPVVQYPDESAQDPTLGKTDGDEGLVPPGEITSSTNTAWIFWAIGLLIGCGIIYALIRHKRIHRDPVTSGRPMRQGGVYDDQAVAYARQVAERSFNTPNFTVTNIERGMISGNNVRVYYAGQPNGSTRTFTNVVGYRGRVRLNDTEEFVYFLQGCGNDVRAGHFHTGEGVQFIPDHVQSSQIRSANEEIQRQSVITATTNERPDNRLSEMANVITALTGPMKGQTNGVLEVEHKDGEIKIKMSFGATNVTSTESVKEEITADKTTLS